MTPSSLSWFVNSRSERRPYADAERSILSLADTAEARAIIAAWPGYAPTPLVRLDGLARRLGLGSIAYKDEGHRFPPGSFKALGGAYAVCRILLDRVEAALPGVAVSPADLIAGRYAELTGAVTVTCATDGNHGRAVAWGAGLFGCKAVIFIHETVSEGREAAIAGFGATVLRAAGVYEDALRAAAAAAQANGWVVISDTAYPGCMDVPRVVMRGYTLMVDEALAQWGSGPPPTHSFVQVGVGGLAAAVAGHLWERFGAARPSFVAVEPSRADCAYQSARAGRPMPATGDLDTVCAGLACGEVSLLAWDILSRGSDAFALVDDGLVIEAMRLLADGRDGDRPVVAGESAPAGLAALIAAAGDPQARRDLGLDANSRVLLFGSEGASDPDLYRSLVGRSAAIVAAAAEQSR